MRLLLISLCVALLAGAPALSTSIPPLTDVELVAQSDLIARVTVLSKQSRWVGRRIVTVHEVRIEDNWKGKGDKGSTTTVAVPGGVVDGIGQKVMGAPELVVGARYVLCLSPATLRLDGAAHHGVVGLWRGVWAEQQDGMLRSFTHGDTPELVLPDVLRARLEAAR